mmetsp:Transcript_23186/g.37766  ORF Transcript_23186/g.37766 Transcript_23186/m.37766 type:complete len:83 (-) Transcript_23186:29-277(-)
MASPTAATAAVLATPKAAPAPLLEAALTPLGAVRRWVALPSWALGATKAMQLPATAAKAVADATRPAMMSRNDLRPLRRWGG